MQDLIAKAGPRLEAFPYAGEITMGNHRLTGRERAVASL